jgi:hypothetical protein
MDHNYFWLRPVLALLGIFNFGLGVRGIHDYFTAFQPNAISFFFSIWALCSVGLIIHFFVTENRYFDWLENLDTLRDRITALDGQDEDEPAVRAELDQLEAELANARDTRPRFVTFIPVR